MPAIVDTAADAVEEVLASGASAAMNRFNVRPKGEPSAPGTLPDAR